MRLLYIIGNGFDLNLDMATKYVDFCTAYHKVKSTSPTLINLKKNIEKGIENWADLELRPGQYTENISTKQEFDEIFDDLSEQLGIYLEKIENETTWELVDQEKLKNYLCNPEEYLKANDRERIAVLKDRYRGDKWYVEIVTLNYTRTFERLFNDKITNVELGKHHNGIGISLLNIFHLHGYIDDLVFGINDLTQLKNQSFHSIKKIANAIVKPNHNRMQGNGIDNILNMRILAANLICVFGSSLGETDKIWWERIGQHILKSECELIIFIRGKEFKKLSHRKSELEDDVKNLFFERAGLSDDEKTQVEERVYVRAWTKMFSDIVTKKNQENQ